MYRDSIHIYVYAFTWSGSTRLARKLDVLVFGESQCQTDHFSVFPVSQHRIEPVQFDFSIQKNSRWTVSTHCLRKKIEFLLTSVFEKNKIDWAGSIRFLKENRVESVEPDVRKKKCVDSAARSTRILKIDQVMWAASTRVSRKKEELNWLNSVCGKKIELRWVSSTLFSEITIRVELSQLGFQEQPNLCWKILSNWLVQLECSEHIRLAWAQLDFLK